MITQIDISNFRSIKQQSIPLKKLNILYGANGSGKSSVAYAPYVFRNFYVNPNQRLNSLFNLGFINLGGIAEIKNFSMMASDDPITVEFWFQFSSDLAEKFDYSNINANNTRLQFSLEDLFSDLQVNLSLSGVKHSFFFDLPTNSLPFRELEISKSVKLNWNGITFETKDISNILLAKGLNELQKTITGIEIISVRRGFFNPIFSTEQASEESLFAMQIRNEGLSFESKIDHYFSKIFNKHFRFVAIPGSSSFYLRTQNTKGQTTDLVNEGFGVNQTVYMLAKLLKQNTSLAFIEEPEIHLHPSAQAKLVDAFIEISQKEEKQIFLSTHSENIVSTVLAKISTGELSKEDVQFYLAKFEDGETKIIPQEVNDKGQIEGGLMNFMETELSNLKSLLGI